MIILEHSTFDARAIGARLGAPDYSYWFVRKAFRAAFEREGIVVPITDPAREVDRIGSTAAAHGEASVYFSFNPPHNTTISSVCPTVPVFAWEFDTLPNESWQGDPRNDWTYVLRQVPAAITHSQFAVQVVRRSLGESYPIWSIPAPLYQPNVRRAGSAKGWQPPTILTISGLAIDAGAVDLSLFNVERSRTDGSRAVKALGARVQSRGNKPLRFSLSGVVYTAVLNPVDQRKNWTDLLAAFIWAFRDNPDATLLLKVTHYDAVVGVVPILSDLSKHGDFRCRVLIVHGMIAQDEYDSLVEVTSYAVNVSTGEGQCLPLMEFMSAGRPAVTPLHTAMLDYVTRDNSFVVGSTLKPTSWPHDPRQAISCMQYAINFSQLVQSYRDSFEVARNQPERYAAMSAAASAALQRFCSDEVVSNRLREVFEHLGVRRRADRLPFLRRVLSRVAT
jgi:glycosyltransferase involved in cell wall biosynthesis